MMIDVDITKSLRQMNRVHKSVTFYIKGKNCLAKLTRVRRVVGVADFVDLIDDFSVLLLKVSQS